MSEVDEAFKELKEGLLGMVKQEAGEYLKEADGDVNAFIRASEADLRKWTAALLEKKLSRSEFESLVRGQKDLAAMKGCTACGMAAARVDRIRNGVVDIVVKTAVRRLT